MRPPMRSAAVLFILIIAILPGGCDAPARVENCSNHLDDDGNGAIDCQDVACTGAQVCMPEICDNDLDDDGDGRFDCADADCAVLSICGGGNKCGNHTIDPGEDCDGTELGGRTCITQGFKTGTLVCAASCSVDTNACSNIAPENCNNGADDDGDEQIDCADVDCHYASICLCGNDVVESDEWCDGPAWAIQVTCESSGFPGGTMACGADCHSVDISGCTPPLCGDGSISNGEHCDDGNAVAGDGCDAACQPEFGPLCATATPLLAGVSQGDNSDGVQGFVGSCTNAGTRAKVFTYSPAVSGVVTIVLNAAVDLDLQVRSTCTDAASELACAGQASGSSSDAVNVPVSAGVPITVIVDSTSASGPTGPFTLIVVQTP